MSDTTRLALPRLDAAQAQKHVTHNEALAVLDALVHLCVLARDVAAPPDAPVEGARYLVGAAPSGGFAGQAGKVAVFDDGAWRFFAPRKGWRAFVESDSRMVVYDGAGWAPLVVDLTQAQNLSRLGVGGMADADNPLFVRVNTASLTAQRTADGGSGDLRLKLDKQQSANVVSQIYQSNWSGRAETGLIGDDSYRIKVSPDGAAWKVALSVDPASGRVYFPNGASDLVAAATVTSGSPAAYLLTAPLRGPLPEGAMFGLVPHAPNATALGVDPTLQIDQIDATPLPLRNFDGSALAQGALEAGRAFTVRKAGGAYCVQTLRQPGQVFNLLEDGGRFGGNPESITSLSSVFTDVSYLIGMNGAARVNFGQARVGITMAAPVMDLIAKIRLPVAQVMGVDFFVMQITAGAGTSGPVSVQGATYYPVFFSSRATPRAVTSSLYFRVLSGSLVLASPDNVTRMLVDGVAHNFSANTPDRVFAAAQGWKHVQCWVAAPNGGTTSFWPLRVTPGSVILIALPAVTLGFETLPWDIGPIPSLRVWR